MDDKIRNLPQSPGVYLFRDKTGKILYVGKAKALRNRVRSHFRSDAAGDPRHAVLMARVADIEVLVTDSEVEALILEANFIKEHRPRYNVNLKDDKSYPYLRVTAEPFPRIFITRKIVRDGSRYFGPYTDVGSLRQLLSAVRRIFPVRTCAFSISGATIARRKHRICLQFHIGRCGGPCEGRISEAEYRSVTDRVVAFIEGRNQALLDDLTARMQTLAGQRQFEEAAALRDQIRSIANFQSRQKVAGDPGDERDLVAVVSDGAGACGVVFDVRDGKIVNRRHFWIDHAIDAPETEVLSGFLKQYYLIADFVPAEIDVPLELEERAGIEAWLSSRRGAPVRLVAPSDAKRTALLDMCGTNARLLLNEFHEQKAMSGDWIAPSVAALQKDLGLTEPPKRIEAFDISNLAGQDAVASMVAFENGKPFKSGYRKFKIRRIEGIDDFAMMAEVVERRVSRLLKEGKEMPDLILVDGGKGQLSAALEALRKCGVENQPVVGLAKRLEEIFRPGLSDPQTLPKSSPSLRLLQHVRDEAHRFAVAFHRSLRGKRAVASVLDSVPGIGAARRSALLSHFGSVDAIRAASVDAIAAVEGMSRKTAERVKEALDAGKPPNSAGAGR